MPEAERSSSRRTADKAGSQLRKLVRTPSAFPAPGLPKPFARQMRLQAMPPRSADAASRHRARDAGLKTTAALGPAKGISAMTARAGADAETAGADSSARSACRTGSPRRAVLVACRLGGVPRRAGCRWQMRRTRQPRQPRAGKQPPAASRHARRPEGKDSRAGCLRRKARDPRGPRGPRDPRDPRAPGSCFPICYKRLLRNLHFGKIHLGFFPRRRPGRPQRSTR